MGRFTELAKRNNISTLCEGRNKIDCVDVITSYADGISINGVDVVDGEDGKYAIITFAEKPDAFMFGGTVLTNLVLDMVKEVGTVDEVNKELSFEPLKIKLFNAKSKKGRSYVSYEVIE